MDIVLKGLVVGPSYLLDKLPKKAFQVVSWDDRRAPATQEATTKAVRAIEAFAASVFDASHGARYMLFVYRTIDEHRACWRAITE